jgi:hypothetical protein
MNFKQKGFKMTSSTLTLIKKTASFEKPNTKNYAWVRERLTNNKTLIQIQQELYKDAKQFDTPIQRNIDRWIFDFKVALEKSVKSEKSVKALSISLAATVLIYTKKANKLKDKNKTKAKNNFLNAIATGIRGLLFLGLLSLVIAALCGVPLIPAIVSPSLSLAVLIAQAVFCGVMSALDITSLAFLFKDNWDTMRRKDWSIIDKMQSFANTVTVEVIPEILEKASEMEAINVTTENTSGLGGCSVDLQAQPTIVNSAQQDPAPQTQTTSNVKTMGYGR